MKHRNEVKKLLKISFTIIQATTFIYSIALGVISFTLYYKTKELIQIKMSTMFLLFSISLTSAAVSLMGFHIINTKKKFKFVIYIFLSLLLLNLQFILALKSSLLPEKSIKWGDNVWDRLSDYQKSFIQDKFKCCGYKDKDDRSALTCEFDKLGCLKVLYDTSVNLRSFVEKSVILILFLESMGLGIIALLKFKK